MWTWIYWRALFERAVRAGSASALGMLGSDAIGAISDVPWYGVLSAAGIGALTSALLSLSSEVRDGTAPASFLKPAPVRKPRKRTGRTGPTEDPQRRPVV